MRGFTYITVLILLFMLGLAQVKIAKVWQAEVRRAKETELLEIGDEFRRAIRSYYELSPGTVKRYPRSLNDLLEDQRFLGVTRHLRRIYLDPMTTKTEWGTIGAPDGGIMGVYSLSTDVPYKQANFKLINQNFTQAKSYRSWQFAYVPQPGVGNGLGKG